MNMTQDWTTFRTWHDLLDRLCIARGYPDNMALADRLCSESGNTTQAAFDTAAKNLRNWRQGLHIPRRRNLLLLEAILQVDEPDGLRDRWNDLYAQAKSGTSASTKPAGPNADQPEPRAAMGRSSRVRLAWTTTALAALAAVSAYVALPRDTESIDGTGTFDGITAEYVRNVSLKVGDAVIVHGARGNECGPAPSWESAKQLLPELVTGILTDGGVGTRMSRQCGGRVPARAILFTATSAGTEQFSLYGDEIHVRIEP